MKICSFCKWITDQEIHYTCIPCGNRGHSYPLKDEERLKWSIGLWAEAGYPIEVGRNVDALEILRGVQKRIEKGETSVEEVQKSWFLAQRAR
jgi:hypothetical protein